MRAFAGRLPSETLSNDVRRGQIGPRVLRLERITPPVADCEDRARRDPRLPMRARLRNCSLACRVGQIAPTTLSGLRAACEGRVALGGARSGRSDRDLGQTNQIAGDASGVGALRSAARRRRRSAFFGATEKQHKLGNAARRAVAKKRNSDCLLVRRRRFSEWRQARAMQPGKIPIWRNRGFANPENRETKKRTLTRLSQVRNART